MRPADVLPCRSGCNIVTRAPKGETHGKNAIDWWHDASWLPKNAVMMVMVPSVEPSSEFVRCMFFFWIITDGYCLVPINDRRLFQFISPAWLKEIRSSSPVFMGKTPWFPVDFPFNQSIDKPWFSLMFSFQSSIQW